MAGMVSPRVSLPARLRQMVNEVNAIETSVESNDTPAGHSMTFEDLPEEIRQKLFNEDLSLRDLSAMSQVSKDSRARVQETMEKLNSRMSIPPTAFASREENPLVAASAPASTTSCQSSIKLLRQQLRIIGCDPAKLSPDEVLNELQKQAVIDEMDSLRWYLQKPIGFSEREKLMKIDLMQLKIDREALEKKKKTIDDFCEKMCKLLIPSDSENRERNLEACKTGLKFIICDQFRTECDDLTNDQPVFNNLQIDESEKEFYFKVNNETYKVNRLNNNELELFKLNTDPVKRDDKLCHFKIEPIESDPDEQFADCEMKYVDKEGRLETIMWVEVRYANGDVYEGQWKDGKPDGHGVYRYADDDVYVGEWRAGKKHGKGTLRNKVGTVLYEGEWKDGQYWTGKGTCTFKGGEVYVGDFQEGQEHGQGILRSQEGTVLYDGEWEKGLQHGQGIMRFNNGDVYKGQWKAGEKDGTATYTFANGDVYDVNF